MALEPRPGQRSVLILYTDVGGGHRAATQALDGALMALDPVPIPLGGLAFLLWRASTARA